MSLEFGITTSSLDVRVIVWAEAGKESSVCGPFSDFGGAQRAALQLISDYAKKLARARTRVEEETEDHLRRGYEQRQHWKEEMG